MKRYRELQESLAPRYVGNNKLGMSVYSVGNRYLVVSYSSSADETAVFLARNRQGDVEDMTDIVSERGLVADEDILRAAVRRIASGAVRDPDNRAEQEAERAVGRWENRIAQMERHIQGAGAQLARMKTDLASAQSALEAGNYRVVMNLTDFRQGSKPWE